MKDKVRRLLFMEEPRPDESIAGYLLRLTQLNDYDKLSSRLTTPTCSTPNSPLRALS